MKFYKKLIGQTGVVSPRELYISRIEEAFEFLKKWDNNEYGNVNKKIRVILINPHTKGHNVLLTKDRTWVISYNYFSGPKKNFNVPYTASLLIHEAFHIQQNLDGKKNYGETAEREALDIQIFFLKKVKDEYSTKWLETKFKERWWEEMELNTNNSKSTEELLEDYKKGRLNILESN